MCLFLVLVQAARRWSELPAEVVIKILQHVDMQQRLQSAAIVSRVWYAAAAAATVHVELQERDRSWTQVAPAFQQWLDAHGTQLQTLKLACESFVWRRTLQLPSQVLHQLQQLDIAGFQLQIPEALTASSMQDEHTPMCPSLVELSLEGATVPSPAAVLQLAQAPQLTHLNLEHLKFEGVNSFDGLKDKAVLQQLHAVMSGLLQQLPQLSVLKLTGVDVGAAAAQQLSAMPRLQELSIDLCDGMTASCLDSLPGSLTSLYMQDNRHGPDRPILPPQLHRLTSLRHLHTDFGAVQPALLAGLLQLQHLQLESCSLLPIEPLAADADSNDAGAAALLAALPYLTQLQHLQVQVPYFRCGDVPLALFSALTASSHLTHLYMSSDVGQMLPPGAAQHMFPAGRQLPQLRCLDFSTNADEWEECCIDAAGLAAIARCCPNLQQLKITGAWGSDADATALLQLPASCTELEVGGPAFTDAAAAVVAQLTHLQRLSLHDAAAGLTDIGLLGLTSLRGLSSLAVCYCKGLSEEVVPKPDDDEYDFGGSLYLWDDEVSQAVT